MEVNISSSSSSIPKVTFANFRYADPIDDQEIYPSNNLLWRLSVLPLETITKVVCTVKLWLGRRDALTWRKPAPLALADRALYYYGAAPEYSFLSYFPTYIGLFYHFEDPVVLKALYNKFRGSEDEIVHTLFSQTKSAAQMLKLANKTFPTDNITYKELMFTCSSHDSKMYRAWLHRLIGKTPVEAYRIAIREEANETLSDWAARSSRGEGIIQLESSLFASRVITRILLGRKITGNELGMAVDYCNRYILETYLANASDEDEARAERAFSFFRETIENILDDPTTAPLFEEQSGNTLSLAQKKAMALLMFFAGQETTGFLLADCVIYLAQRPDLVETIRKACLLNEIEGGQEIKRLINRLLALHPPAYVVARKASTEHDLCLEYQLENESFRRKLFLPAASILSGRIINTAHRVMKQSPEILDSEDAFDIWSAFGSGRHSCPGKYLALLEVEEMIRSLVLDYNLSTDYTELPEVVGRITLQFIDTIPVYIKPLNGTCKTSDEIKGN